MNTDSHIAAALIAGGRSSRMGEDKAFLTWNGEPLWRVQLGKLSDFPQIYLSHNAEQSFDTLPPNVTCVPDSKAEAGPLAALVDLLTIAAKDEVTHLLVLAVDLPTMTTTYLRELTKDLGTQGRVTQLEDSDFYEPLVAVYPVASTLAVAKTQLAAEGKHSLQRLVRALVSTSRMQVTRVSGETTSLFSNVNTPEELAAVRPATRLSKAITIRKFRNGSFQSITDHVVAEEPLEVRVEGRSVAVMMRTPGHDEELAAGFLLTEGVIKQAADIFEIAQCQNVDPGNEGNTLDVLLAGSAKDSADLDSLSRHVFTSSSCGICGKATIESVFQGFEPLEKSDFAITPETLLSLPNRLREAQETFEKTGGLHASALFTADGTLETIREDAGRHNALDKVIGRALLDGKLPLSQSILLVSGRVSFELMQKALAAGIHIVAGISAPSSLAVEFAEKSGQTLVGFLRERTFNVYAGHAIQAAPKVE